MTPSRFQGSLRVIVNLEHHDSGLLRNLAFS